MMYGPPNLKACQITPGADGKPGKIDPQYAAHKARCNYLGRYEPWEEFLARRIPGKWVGVPRNTKYAYNKYLRNGGKMEFAEWLPSYTPTGIKKPRSEELTDRDRAMIARNVQVTKERIEAKLRRMCA